MTAQIPVTGPRTRHDAHEAVTLAGEHERLMRDVIRRAAPVLALLQARAWPHAELGTLTSVLRASVLRQVSDEEVHLFPHDCSAPPLAELSADHVRLHALTVLLERAHARPCPPAELQALIEELLTTLGRHLGSEQQVLAALPEAVGEVPGVAGLVAADRTWLAEDDAPVVMDLDAVPTGRAIERILRLRPGQIVELHAHDDQPLHAVRRWLHEFDVARFGLDHVTKGSDHSLRVTCRGAGPSADVAYPASNRDDAASGDAPPARPKLRAGRGAWPTRCTRWGFE